MHQFATGDQVSGVTCVGWVSNVISKKASSTSSKKEATAWQHFLAEDAILSEKTSLDLPRDLSLIDIEASLPRLSVLAAGGSS